MPSKSVKRALRFISSAKVVAGSAVIPVYIFSKLESIVIPVS
jgi:hypothetical protein